MHTIDKGDKVLVSGANGYLAMWVVRTLLERGYAVRAAVRNASKAHFMVDYFAKLGYKDALETVLVEDITKEGAFDEAVTGVDAIAHTASPFHPNAKTPDDLILPAVDGTLSMLRSALNHGKSVKRVVVTSSTAAIEIEGLLEPRIYSETDWNEQSPRQVTEQGDKTHPLTIYRASKTLAERAAWDFVKDHSGKLSWDLCTINPPYIYGPPIHDVKSLESLNQSLKVWTNFLFFTQQKGVAELLNSQTWVDVRDAALAHVLALEKHNAGGERIVVTAGPYNWQEWLDAAASLPVNPLPNHALYRGDPSLTKETSKYMVDYDTSKEARILGIKFRTKVETTKDTLEEFAARAW